MIIPCFVFKSLQEYLENFGVVKIPRPKLCLACGASSCFWGHGSFQRTVIQDGTETSIRIPRFLCSSCGKTVSLLFSFLVAFRQHAAGVIATSIESYGTSSTSYRQISNEMAPVEAQEAPRPGHTSIFRWVQELSSRAAKLNFQIQKELTLRGKDGELLCASNSFCPNAWKAKTRQKQIDLEILAEGLQLGGLLVEEQVEVLNLLSAFFLEKVETIQMILSNHLIKLSAPQNLEHAIF